MQFTCVYQSHEISSVTASVELFALVILLRKSEKKICMRYIGVLPF